MFSKLFKKEKKLSRSAADAKSWSLKLKPKKKKETRMQYVLRFADNYIKETDKELKSVYQNITNRHLKNKIKEDSYSKFKTHWRAITAALLLRAFNFKVKPDYEEPLGLHGRDKDERDLSINFTNDLEQKFFRVDKNAWKCGKFYWDLGAIEEVVDTFNKECFDNQLDVAARQELLEGLDEIYNELEKTIYPPLSLWL